MLKEPRDLPSRPRLARWRGGEEATTAGQEAAVLDTTAAGGFQPLDPRVIQLRRTSAALFTAVLGIGSLVTALVNFAFAGPSLSGAALRAVLWAAAVGLLAWHTYRWPAIAYQHTSYRLDERGLEIRRGVFWRTAVNVPRSRVQHTDVSQGPLERRYGLGTLVVYTAGTDYARVSLPGLAHDTALQIRDQLIASGGGDAV